VTANLYIFATGVLGSPPLSAGTEVVVASENSFDIVSKVDLQEVDNAVNQTLKEIGQRWDFKNTKVTLTREAQVLTLHAEDEARRRAVIEILSERLASRKVPIKALEFKDPQPAAVGTLRQEIQVQAGITQDQAKEIVKVLKGSGIKVQPAIQGDSVRVRGKNKDDLQAAIRILRGGTFEFDMQFTNYR
jgi:uncharacterized protein YajQ (UPF0234 family)